MLSRFHLILERYRQTDRQTDRFATTILNFKKIIFGHRLSNLGHVQQLTSRIDCLDSMLDRSAVGQLSSLSSRTKWQRLLAGSVSPAGSRRHFVLLDIPIVQPIRLVSC